LLSASICFYIYFKIINICRYLKTDIILIYLLTFKKIKLIKTFIFVYSSIITSSNIFSLLNDDSRFFAINSYSTHFTTNFFR